ncbi:MAG: hypothetical protein B7Z55_03175 [Planctomycetales bacterium 12-60-4]|nr:MAG: hypothetical protein B7Z55_03175 [Planctomycetales bacterium 12-60-4]
MLDSEIIVVSGLPRSGTSLMMQMLAQGGVPVLTDGERSADVDNPRGYLEFEPVKRLQHDASWVPQARGHAVKMISFHLEFLPPEETYRVIFMERSLDEVLASQSKMLERRNVAATTSPENLRRSFELHLRRIGNWLQRQPNMSVLPVPYAEVLADPLTMTARINQFLGHRVRLPGMIAAIDAGLYRNRSDVSGTPVQPARD